jgi:exodeoxyribonuclease VII large subunit
LKTAPNQPSRRIFSVSQLTAKIKQLLEQKYSMIWISGEISNLHIPASGHAYFTLKDAKAQIAAVMFKGQYRQLKFAMDDGQSIVGLGRISVYEPRGAYQIILEYVEPKGIGALQIAFEQLKTKLDGEGLFDERHKKQLPFLPRSIAVITAPAGAVIQDILKVLDRRFPNMAVQICPVRVQGDAAADQIVHAIDLINRLDRHDLILIARGGGSLEDLAPFNSEVLARSIFASRLPVVSAVGHETDFTIADFVADMRASTPSVAAELIAPKKADLQALCLNLETRSLRAVLQVIGKLKEKAAQLQKALVHPGKKIQDAHLHIDHLTSQLQKSMTYHREVARSRLAQLDAKMVHVNPEYRVSKYQVIIDTLKYKIKNIFNKLYSRENERHKAMDALLIALNPESILKRGYSITRTLPQKRILTDASGFSPGQRIEIQLAKGRIEAEVRNVATGKGR